ADIRATLARAAARAAAAAGHRRLARLPLRRHQHVLHARYGIDDRDDRRRLGGRRERAETENRLLTVDPALAVPADLRVGGPRDLRAVAQRLRRRGRSVRAER